jgi:hypothetical protein
MPLWFALAALVVVLAAGALGIGARRQSLRAPEGAAGEGRGPAAAGTC